jgi:hypothetical protein
VFDDSSSSSTGFGPIRCKVLCVESFAEFLDLLEVAIGGISSKSATNATQGPKNGGNPKLGFYLLCLLLSLTT